MAQTYAPSHSWRDLLRGRPVAAGSTTTALMVETERRRGGAFSTLVLGRSRPVPRSSRPQPASSLWHQLPPMRVDDGEPRLPRPRRAGSRRRDHAPTRAGPRRSAWPPMASSALLRRASACARDAGRARAHLPSPRSLRGVEQRAAAGEGNWASEAASVARAAAAGAAHLLRVVAVRRLLAVDSAGGRTFKTAVCPAATVAADGQARSVSASCPAPPPWPAWTRDPGSAHFAERYMFFKGTERPLRRHATSTEIDQWRQFNDSRGRRSRPWYREAAATSRSTSTRGRCCRSSPSTQGDRPRGRGADRRDGLYFDAARPRLGAGRPVQRTTHCGHPQHKEMIQWAPPTLP